LNFNLIIHLNIDLPTFNLNCVSSVQHDRAFFTFLPEKTHHDCSLFTFLYLSKHNVVYTIGHKINLILDCWQLLLRPVDSVLYYYGGYGFVNNILLHLL